MLEIQKLEPGMETFREPEVPPKIRVFRLNYLKNGPPAEGGGVGQTKSGLKHSQ